ncbi:hypothetical protein [Larkinella sp. C7]|uniref:hypothetical protein n=1 Tax=Larkinella sp. C7 TaxID=2576607 RepID=UPI0011112F2A|nr:hypothetical protein [Larkinella sp. C7]
MKMSIPPRMWPLKATCLKIALILPFALTTLSSCEPDAVVIPEIEYGGIFTVQEADPKESYLLTLRKNPEKAKTFTIENLANLVKEPLQATVTNNKLVIVDQAFTNYLGDKYTISGEGELIDETLVLRYSINGHNGYAGSVFAKKQGDGK